MSSKSFKVGDLLWRDHGGIRVIAKIKNIDGVKVYTLYYLKSQDFADFEEGDMHIFRKYGT